MSAQDGSGSHLPTFVETRTLVHSKGVETTHLVSRHRSNTAGGKDCRVCPNDATQWTKHRPSQLSTQATKVARPSKTCRWFSRTYSPLQRCSGQGAARPLHMLPQFPKKWHHVGKTKIQKCSRKVVFAPAAMNASSTSGHRPWHTLQDHNPERTGEGEGETQPTPTKQHGKLRRRPRLTFFFFFGGFAGGARLRSLQKCRQGLWNRAVRIVGQLWTNCGPIVGQ